MKCFIIIISCLFLELYSSTKCNSASFNCQLAVTNVEKMICIDTQLSQMDKDLASLYTEALHNVVDPELQKQQQRGWLRKTRNLCTDVPCLMGAYTNRMTELVSLKKNNIQLAKTTKSEDDVCNLVAEYANRGALGEIVVSPKMDIEISEEQLKKIKDLTYGSINEKWSFDFNRDGIQDLFAIDYQGSAAIGSAYLLSGAEGSSVYSIDDFEDGHYDIWFLTIEGRFYVLSGNHQRLGRLRAIDDTCEFHYICSYAQKEKPEIELIKGKDNQMCVKAGLGDVVHVDYTYIHSVPKFLHFISGSIKDGLAKVDIDNDGKPDNIVRIECSSGGGRGWDAKYIATTDETRTNIPSSKLNDLLLHKLGGNNGPDMSMFVYDDVTYLDAQGDNGDRQIYRINGSQTESICEFQGRIINFDKKGY